MRLLSTINRGLWDPKSALWWATFWSMRAIYASCLRFVELNLSQGIKEGCYTKKIERPMAAISPIMAKVI
jgi:hypothetical protein